MPCLQDLVKPWVDLVPDKPAVRYVLTEPHSVTEITYAQLWAAALKLRDELAQHTHSRCVVGVMCEDNPWIPACLIGILSLPAAFLPLCPAMPKLQLVQLVRKLQIKVIITDTQTAQKFGNVNNTKIFKKPLDDIDLYFVLTTTEEASAEPQDLAYVITTSGTTGEPKIVKVPHQCILPNIEHLSEIYGLTSVDLVYQASPLTFDPSIVEIFTTLSVGATLVVTEEGLRQRPGVLVAEMARQGVTVVQATPTLFYNIGPHILSTTLLRSPRPGQYSGLRVLALGGERCPALSTLRSWRGHGNQTTFVNLYGVTEVSSWATWHVVTGDEGKEIPLGRPLKDTLLEIRPLEDHEHDLDKEKDHGADIGELLIGGSTRQCLLDAESSLSDDITMRPTGDVVCRDRTGHVWYVGRLDDQVKRHGKRVNLLVLETTAEACSDVSQAAATCYHGNHTQIYLFVQQTTPENEPLSKSSSPPEDSLLDLSPEAITFAQRVEQRLLEQLPAYYRPDQIVAVTTMPLTVHGKVDKKRLVRCFRDHLASKPHPATLSALHTALSAHWMAATSSINPPSFTTQFTTSGADSMAAVAFCECVQTELVHCRVPGLLELVLSGEYREVLAMLAKILGFQDVETLKLQHGNLEDGNAANGTFQEHPGTSVTKRMNESMELKPDKHLKTEPGDVKHRAEVVQNVRQRNDQRGNANNVTADEEESSNHQPVWTISRASTYLCNGRTISPSLIPKCSTQESHSKSTTACINELRPCWKYFMRKCVDSSPVICIQSASSPLVVVGSHSRTQSLTAVDLLSGSPRWTVSLDTRIEAPPCVSKCGRYVIVGGYSGHIYIVNLSDGSIHWTYETGNQVKCGAVVDPTNGNVYCGSHDHKVYCLDIESRSCVWSTDVHGAVFATPCISAHPHHLYVATLGSNVVCVQPLQGSVLWTVDLRYPVFSSPSVTPTGVCVATVNREVCLISHRGTVVWTYNSFGPVFSSISVLQEIPHPKDSTKCSSQTIQSFVFGDQTGRVSCINSDGLFQWTTELSSKVYSSPFVYHDDRTDMDLVIACCSEGLVCVLDQGTGKVLRKETLGTAEIYSSPVVWQGKLVVGSRDNYLYCCDIS